MSTTIQALIIETLLEHDVVEYNGKQLKVGKSYDEVLEVVKAKVKVHPMLNGCETSKNCITWYASKMRNSNTKFFNQLMLEIERPRMSTKSHKAPELPAEVTVAPSEKAPKAGKSRQVTAKA